MEKSLAEYDNYTRQLNDTKYKIAGMKLSNMQLANANIDKLKSLSKQNKSFQSKYDDLCRLISQNKQTTRSIQKL